LQAALSTRLTAVAFFLAPQDNWLNSFVSDAQVQKFCIEREAAHLHATSIVPHSHLFNNLASRLQLHRLNSMQCLRNELRDCERLEIPHIVLHPGSVGKQHPREEGFDNFLALLNALLAETRTTVILLENSAGQGQSIGCTIAELAQLIQGVHDKSRVGICLDTQHLYAMGYDLNLPHVFDNILDEVDSLLGLPTLWAIHVNNSAVPLGSRRDRHANLGAGHIRPEFFHALVRNPRIKHLPFILETITSENPLAHRVQTLEIAWLQAASTRESFAQLPPLANIPQIVEPQFLPLAAPPPTQARAPIDPGLLWLEEQACDDIRNALQSAPAEGPLRDQLETLLAQTDLRFLDFAQPTVIEPSRTPPADTTIAVGPTSKRESVEQDGPEKGISHSCPSPSEPTSAHQHWYASRTLPPNPSTVPQAFDPSRYQTGLAGFTRLMSDAREGLSRTTTALDELCTRLAQIALQSERLRPTPKPQTVLPGTPLQSRVSFFGLSRPRIRPFRLTFSREQRVTISKEPAPDPPLTPTEQSEMFAAMEAPHSFNPALGPPLAAFEHPPAPAVPDEPSPSGPHGDYFAPAWFTTDLRSFWQPLRGIQLDVASNRRANASVRANRFLSLDKGHNSLTDAWDADTIFCNPPPDRQHLSAWGSRIVSEAAKPGPNLKRKEIVAILPLTGARWQQNIFAAASLVLMPKEPMIFWNSSHKRLVGRLPIMVAYFGGFSARFAHLMQPRFHVFPGGKSEPFTTVLPPWFPSPNAPVAEDGNNSSAGDTTGEPEGDDDEKVDFAR
jgi:apurinic endonuclease APN1